MRAIHFGAGNIGRGFIGEVLSDNQFNITYIDINETIISELNSKQKFNIFVVGETTVKKEVHHVSGINSQTHYEDAVQAFLNADLVTISVGVNNLKHIAQTLADGIRLRSQHDKEALDVIACENMIGGSQHLKQLVFVYLNQVEQAYVHDRVGFPNAAVDRIVPEHHDDDVLSVRVEEFKEWLVENRDRKSNVELIGVQYVDALEPYIERKLFTVNTGHASLAFLGLHAGYVDTNSAINDQEILKQLQQVLKTTSTYLRLVHGFSEDSLSQYIDLVMQRFQNPGISDDLNRIARNPMTKLSNQERFIKPLQKLHDLNMDYETLIAMVALGFLVHVKGDAQSEQLHAMIKQNGLLQTIQEVTGLDTKLSLEIQAAIKNVTINHDILI